MVQYCTACSRYQHPPKEACWQCSSAGSMEFRPVSGRGTIHSYHIMHDVRIRVFQDQQPFNISSISLEEDPGIIMLTNLPGTAVGGVEIGAKVQVEFEDIGDGRKLPQFRVVG